jgi:transcriptional regulator with PAS, ATPase and Fis domain
MIGRSYAIREIHKTAKQIGPTTASVFITGESGTGKELLARTIHDESPRRDRPFVAINSAAIPEGLIESELFGHERGSFTGAIQGRLGCFELANTGTLFLDEITEMSLDAQAKVLRALQERKFRRIGGSREVSTDIRVIAASNKNPVQARRAGILREDLFYRLSVVPIDIPPLRHRIEDVRLLAEEFVRHFGRFHKVAISGVEEEFMRALEAYPWPGNVRELQNVIERVVVMSRAPTLSVRDLPKEFRAATGPPQDGVLIKPGIALKTVEDELFAQTLAFTGGNKKRTAKMLGISRRGIYYKLDRLNAHLSNGHLNGTAHRNGRKPRS